jgi:lariat debranching enzyme
MNPCFSSEGLGLSRRLLSLRSVGHFEKVPYDRSTVRSAYHTRKYDIHRLFQLTPRPGTSEDEDKVDIFLSHDWPVGITRFGDENGLLRRKTFFTEEVSLFRG